MTTHTQPNLDLIIEGIMEARTITDDVKLRLLNELKTEGPTDAVMAKVDALFADEIASAETDLGQYLAMLPQVEASLSAAEKAALPALIENSADAQMDLRSFVAEEKGKIVSMESSLDTMLRSSSDEADANDADAIRKSLGLNI